jgi:alpha-D-xyloside xylohydrolase
MSRKKMWFLTRLKNLTAAVVIASAVRASAVTLSLSSVAPEPTPGDVYNFVGASMDMDNVHASGDAPATNGPANDRYTYIANDQADQGQTFTTGASAGGYQLTEIWIRHAGYTANTIDPDTPQSNGTWWQMGAGGGLTLRITSPAKADTSGFVLASETYTPTGTEGWPESATSSLNGDEHWLHFTLSTPVALAANTTYGFDLTSIINNNTFFEWLGNSTNVFSGGAAYRGGTAGVPDNALNRLVGDRVFLVRLKAASAGAAVSAVQKDSDGVTLKLDPGTLKLRVFSPRVVEVVYVPGDVLPTSKSLSVIAPPSDTNWKLSETVEDIALGTDELTVRVNRASGAVTFCDKTGKTLLAEKAGGGKSLKPTRVGELDTWRSTQIFELPADEAVYGLGQHPDAPMAYRGAKLHLQQENRIVAVPVLLSSRGYGVLWDNPAVTDVDVGATDPALLSWTSEAADAIDYYFIAGPQPDDVIAAYRDLTGKAPMFPKWTWGLWQCREHYETQNELLGVVSEYRRRGIPLDGIIQDWQYWRPGGWGSHEFDPARYPDPTGMVKTVHDENAHIIISVWARFDLGLANLAELEEADAVYPPVYPNVYPAGHGKWYDPFNPAGRRLYWQFLSKNLFSRGFDGWWMDASEAELGGKWGQMRDLTTGAGPGAKVFNAYPLMHSKGVYEGQRAETSDKRAFILTRSAFAGQQRNGAVTWSGDTSGRWDIFKKQVPAGLNFVSTGIPYWNTDIGGFFGGDPGDPRYRELFTRWFQFGTFCPMCRVHGTGKSKDLWRFGPDAEKILVNYDQLRYHLLPYIYSTSWKVTSEGYTLMRPLVMDFRADANVLKIPDQFMFGPALMACPVTEAGARSRSVYLPAGTTWFDFWTGEVFAGGQTIAADAPLATMPLFVRAGAIIPHGPDVQYAAQKTDPIELRVYRGADGAFTLYEDEGDNYNYEKGAYATIPVSWDEANQALLIGDRAGKFPGMAPEHTFRVVFVSSGHGVGVPTTETPDTIIHYTGKAVKVIVTK